MKSLASRLVLILLAIAWSSPAIAQDAGTTKVCKPNSSSGKCLLRLITTLQGQIATLQGQVTALQTALTAVQNNNALALGSYFSVDTNPENGLKGPNVILKGANFHIESGSGNTVDATGLGNLVIGYDEDSLDAAIIDTNRIGSHNLVIGPQHEFTASGSVVSGFENFTSANYSSVIGGECNAAGSSTYPSIPCGSTGVADAASVAGGFGNLASDRLSSVSGGQNNIAMSIGATICGGFGNLASGPYSSVSGGDANTASKPESSVSGGASNMASGPESTVSGGYGNTASGQNSSILGGNGVTLSTNYGTSP